jgi:hypothetical protein
MVKGVARDVTFVLAQSKTISITIDLEYWVRDSFLKLEWINRICRDSTALRSRAKLDYCLPRASLLRFIAFLTLVAA